MATDRVTFGVAQRPSRLVGTADIAEILGISRQRADQLSRERGFPEPIAIVNTNVRVWERATIESWASANR